MKNLTTKHKLFASILFSIFLVSCRSELPIQDMNTAKREISRAESLQAAEYAPEEMEEAKKSLYQAHDKASEEDGSEAKKLANYATSKAYDALEKSLPKLSAKARDEATEAIDKADEAYATGLAPQDFDKAIALRKEGDQNMERGDQTLSEFLQERNEDKKGSLRQQAFREYELSYNNYKDSQAAAENARKASLESRGELRQSARFVEEDLNTAETYLGGPNDATEAERQSIASAYQDIDKGELKKANEKIQASRTKSRTILANSIQNYARERLQTATEVVEDSNAKFEKIPESTVDTNPGLKKDYESARENLGAANEALASAGNLYSQEKFEDSIKQSEEAIRLSEIVLDQTKPMSPEAMAAARKRAMDAENSKAQANDSSTSSDSKDLKEGWSKYKVKKTQPEDCLWRIAEKKEFYGNAKLWPRIYQANKSKIKNKNLIYPNQVLYIPPKSGAIGSPFKPVDKFKTSQERLNLKDEEPMQSEESMESNPVEEPSTNSSSQDSRKSVNGPDASPMGDGGTEEELLENDSSEDESNEED